MHPVEITNRKINNGTMFMFSKSTEKPPVSQLPWLALGLDMDGCFMSNEYCKARLKMIAEKNRPLTMEEEANLLISSNEAALKIIVNKIAGYYSRLYILSGTKRQDFKTDQVNNDIHGTISSFQALEIITNYFQNALPTMQVELLNFLMADTSIGSQADEENIGVTFSRALEELNGAKNIEHPNWNGIQSDKFTQVYAHSQLLARKWELEYQSKLNILYCLIDDMDDIHTNLTSFIRSYPKNFPLNMAYNFIQYSQDSTDELATKLNHTSAQFDDLIGMGEVDVNFMRTLRSMEESLGYERSYKDYNYRELAFDDIDHAGQVFQEHRNNVSSWNICRMM